MIPRKQQSTSESKPREAGQLFDPQTRPSWHMSWESQSPSFSEQEWQLQNPKSPLVILEQSTTIIIIFYVNFFSLNVLVMIVIDINSNARSLVSYNLQLRNIYL